MNSFLFTYNHPCIYYFTAQPSTNYSGISLEHPVELPDDDSTVSTVLQCDIQPGALRQRYSVQWKSTYQNITNIIDSGPDKFNLTLMVSSSLDGFKYQCQVTIDHDGRRLTITYEGREILLVISISQKG